MLTISEQTVDAFHNSLERCGKDSEFLGDFYQFFTASSPEVAAKFSRTNFKTQTRVLKSSFYIAMMAADQHGDACQYLAELAKSHNRFGLDIKPEFYTLWLESMIKSVQLHDPLFDDSVEKAWRDFMQPAIDYMKSCY